MNPFGYPEQDPYAVGPFTEEEALAAVAPMGNAPGVPQGFGMYPQLPPGGPSAPSPAPGAFPPPGPPGGGFSDSPYAAMVGAAAQNLSNIAGGGRAVRDPLAAYQQAVRDQAQEARDEELHPLTVEAMELKLDPGSNYKRLVEDGLIDPTEMTYAEYMTLTSRNQLPSSVREWQYYSGLSPEAKAEYLQLRRAPQIIDTGGGTVATVGPGGAAVPVPGSATAEQYGQREGVVEGAKEQATGDVQYDLEQVAQATNRIYDNQEAYRIAERMRDLSTEYRARLESGEINTGLIQGFFLDTFGVGPAELAELNSDQVLATLENLGITNLAPVTVQELQYVARLWADISREEEPNIGTLNRAVARSESLMERIQLDTRNQLTRVEEYGGAARRDSILASNPWAQSLVQPPGGGAGDDAGGDDAPPGDEDTPAEEWGIDANGNPVRLN